MKKPALTLSVVSLLIVAFIPPVAIGSIWIAGPQNSPVGPPDASWTNNSAAFPIDSFWSVSFADFNGDGNLDLAAGSGNYTGSPGNGIMVWWGDGAGGWTKKPGPVTSGVFAGLACKDIDGDGKSDMVASSMNYTCLMGDSAGTSRAAQSRGICAWKSNGDGTWTNWTAGLPENGDYYRLELINVTGDNNVDIIAGYKNGIEIYEGDGAGSWTKLSSTGLPDTFKVFDVSVSDANKDGYQDIAYSTQSNDIGFYFGDGAGHWSGASTGLPNTEFNSYGSILLEDLNLDGYDDILAGSLLQGGMRLWVGDGTGTWTETPTSLPSLNEYYDLQSADLDKDGKNDLLAVRAGYIFDKPAQLEVHLATGPLSWSAPENLTLGRYGYAVAVGDFDKCGMPDIATASELGLCCWSSDIPNPIPELYITGNMAACAVAITFVIIIYGDRRKKSTARKIAP